MSANPEWREVREEEVPPHVWEFQVWLKRFWEDQGEPSAWDSSQFQRVVTEAARRGITINADGVIGFRTQ